MTKLPQILFAMYDAFRNGTLYNLTPIQKFLFLSLCLKIRKASSSIIKPGISY